MGCMMRREGMGEHGQSTVEYALVLLAFLSMVVALGAIWQAAHEGRLLGSARDATSHNMDEGVTVGLLQDLLAY
jgi:hypothetical protein